jgi:hypothetical protein
MRRQESLVASTMTGGTGGGKDAPEKRHPGAHGTPGWEGGQ